VVLLKIEVLGIFGRSGRGVLLKIEVFLDVCRMLEVCC